ncbi:hypothetical protein [Paraburkholderia unamae]|uniref:Uncharacterized protein n=1 Tax=Paraburkholderia unamae TaxID=219649 RepID=A0ABX5KPA7_9BURK|nr:hypothetical protein [Paraburkholderia unamae]PVX84318.1 hypothetical protein C7402_105159 [Paraburkholderia unamae]
MSQKQTTELTVVERAALALGTSERETKLRELVANFTTITEIKNAAARDQCHGALMTLRTTRTDITKAGKTARDDANAFSKAVIAEEKRLVAIIEPEETRLQTLRDVWDEAREAEKRAAAEADARRIAAIRAQINEIRACVAVAVGKSSAEIDGAIAALEAEQIGTDRFAELTGEAEAARGETLDKLAEMFAAARKQEAEAARLAAERAELERQRAELDEQRRRDEEARVERERVEREAREAREAAERAEREARERAEAEQRARAEAARREQQAREDAERRAAIDAEERRLAAERAEMQRRQAELARAEAERHEREQAALREMEEIRERAEREKKLRERAENRAAMLAPEPTGGNWSVSVRGGGCIVTDTPIPGAVGTGHADVEAYGGHLIAESIYRPADAHILAAARDMFDALRQWQHAERVADADELANARTARDAAIERAIYVPTEEAVAA